jgi:DNA polymerase-3 subunit delta
MAVDMQPDEDAMTTLKALELRQHLNEAAQAPVCILAGEDDSLRAYCLRLLKEAAALPGQPGSTIREFEDKADARDVFDELKTVPFLGLAGRRTVVIHDGDAFVRAHAERLAEYLKAPSPTSTLILCLSKPPNEGQRRAPRRAQAEGRPGRPQDLMALAQARGIVVLCAAIRWRDAEQWMRSRVAEMGLRLTPKAAAALMETVGSDLLAIENELDKLAAYCGPHATISERDVGEVVSAGRSRSVFDLSNAVCSGDAPEALRLCAALLLRGETPEGIVAHLARQIRRLWQVRRLQGRDASERDIARQLDLPDFAVSQSLKLVGKLTDDWLARQFELLSAADFECKATSLRSGEEGVWLENLLARMCNK